MKLLLGGSLIFSILHSILLWNQKPGIAVTIFCIALLMFFIYFLTKTKQVKNRKALILGVPIALLSLTYFLFNNYLFQTMNLLVICALWLILIISATNTEVKWKFLMTKIFDLIIGPFEYFQSIGKEIKKLVFKQGENSQRAETTKKVVKALVLIIPIVLIVICLLGSADSIFASLFSGMTNIMKDLFNSRDLPSLIVRIMVIVIIFFYMASFLYNILQENSIYHREKQMNQKEIRIETITIQVLLTVLNLIYLIFCTIQILYLFIKTGMTSELSHAQYARQGFFQLMFVSLLNFMLLCVIHANSKQASSSQKKYIRIMELGMELFTEIIVISAWYRMFLYEQAYGYTYLRLFVYFILAAEFLFMVPTMWYTLGKKVNLLKVGLTIVTTLYLILNYINVDAVIARNNINRYYENPEKDFDFSYLKYYTGTDAIPVIKQLLDTEDTKLKEQVNQYLKSEKRKLEETESWQEYNLSKQKAKEVLENS